MVIEDLIRQYGLWAVFFGVMLEGDLSLLFAGVLAHYGLFSFGEAILTGTAGGFVGDGLSYLIGYTGKKKIKTNRFYHRAQPRLEQLSARFGLYSVFLVKYVYGLRTASAVFWGFAHMPFRRFGPLTLLSCWVWALLLAGAGYFFSGAVSVLVGHVRQISLILLIAVAIALVVARKEGGEKMNRLALQLLALSLLAGLCACQKEASLETVTSPIATPKPGPTPTIDPRVTDLERLKPGMQAPDFALTNHDGVVYRLSAFQGKKAVVLVFYRGYFCGSCVGQLGQLKSLLSDKEKQGVQIVGISNDTREETQNTLIEVSKFPGKADYLLLEDRGHATVDGFGISNPAEFKPGIPYPVTYIIDKQGKVTHRFLDTVNYERASNEWIRASLKEIGAVS